MKNFRRWGYLILIVLFIACVPANYSGSMSGGKSGLGGTGGPLADKKTGIGGTGFLTGNDGEVLGIVGRITGFGSIWVNGVEVEFDPNALIYMAGSNTSPADLAVGQVVEVLATNHTGEVWAESISIRHEVIGQISSVSADGKALQVLDQQVIIASDTIIPSTWVDSPTVDSVVRVSGFRDTQGRILASRIEEGLPDEADFLIGMIQAKSAEDMVVAGIPVISSDMGGDLQVGDTVRIGGRFKDGVLILETVGRDAAQLFSSRIDRLIVEAVLIPGAGESFSLGAMPFRVKSVAGLEENHAVTGDMPHLFIGVMGAGGEVSLERISRGVPVNRGVVTTPMGRENSMDKQSTMPARQNTPRIPSGGPASLRRMNR